MRRKRAFPDIVVLPDGFLLAVAALSMAGLALTITGLIRAFANGGRSLVAFACGAGVGCGTLAVFAWGAPGLPGPTRGFTIVCVLLPSVAAGLVARMPFASPRRPSGSGGASDDERPRP